MDGYASRRRSMRLCVLVLGLGAIGSMLAGHAVAGCGSVAAVRAAPMGWAPSYSGATEFLRVVDDGGQRNPGIVGMWRFTLVSDGTAYPTPIAYGTVIDTGTMQWHGDGTEITISGSRAPSTGDVCMGVWEQTGRATFRLKHIALAWVSADSTPPASPAVFLGPAILHEEVTLSRSGHSFEGTVTLDQYAKDETTLLEHIGAKVIATRVVVD